MIRAEERSIRMVVIIIYLAVFAGGFGVVLLEECLKEYRRQTRGLTLEEQFQRTMADLDRDVRENINTGVVRMRQECKRMEGQKQRNAELRQKYPELYQ